MSASVLVVVTHYCCCTDNHATEKVIILCEKRLMLLKMKCIELSDAISTNEILKRRWTLLTSIDYPNVSFVRSSELCEVS